MEPIRVGYHAFVSDRLEEFGAIRGVSDDGRSLTVYVENAGEFDVGLDAVEHVSHQKVTFDPRRLHEDLRDAIDHAHDAEIGNDDAITIRGDEEDEVVEEQDEG